MVEGIARRGDVGNTCSCVMRSEPGLSHSKNVYCFGNYKISKRYIFTNGTNVSGGHANVPGPGLRLTYHASSKVKANLNVGLELNIGSNFRLKQRLRHGRLCKCVKESCVVMYLEGIEIASEPCASVLRKVKSRLLEVTEQDNNKTHKENTGDI